LFGDSLVRYGYSENGFKTSETYYQFLYEPFIIHAETSRMKKVGRRDFYGNYRGLGLDKTEVESADGVIRIEYRRNGQLIFVTDDKYSISDNYPYTFISGSYEEYKSYFEKGGYLPEFYDLTPEGIKYNPENNTNSTHQGLPLGPPK